MIQQLLDFVFPKFCLFCSKHGEYLCDNCYNQLPLITEQHCHVCGKTVKKRLVHEQCVSKTSLDGVIAVCLYNKLSGKLIHELKYNFISEIAKELGPIMKSKLDESSVKWDIICPVPLSRKRLWWRGFNQSELLVNAMNFNVGQRVLARTKYKINQAELNREARFENIKNSFKVSGNVKGKSILLIDDVMTTGATLEECAKLLKQHSATTVYALVWARDILN